MQKIARIQADSFHIPSFFKIEHNTGINDQSFVSSKITFDMGIIWVIVRLQRGDVVEGSLKLRRHFSEKSFLMFYFQQFYFFETLLIGDIKFAPGKSAIVEKS